MFYLERGGGAGNDTSAKQAYAALESKFCLVLTLFFEHEFS
jgi:hypothetical protein